MFKGVILSLLGQPTGQVVDLALDQVLVQVQVVLEEAVLHLPEVFLLEGEVVQEALDNQYHEI